MKTNIKALELIEKGMTAKTVSKLTESQVNILHSKLLGEQGSPSGKGVTTISSKNPQASQIAKNLNSQGVNVSMTEIEEDETDDLTDSDALASDVLQNVTGQDTPHDNNDEAPDGMDDDSDDNRKMMGMAEANDKENKPNPWAICHTQVGPKKSRKWERCVREVKKQLGEGKNPVSLFLENEIMKIVERNILPRITKGDLIKHLNEGENFATKHIQSFGTKSSPKNKKEVDESEPAVSPTKPKTKPTTDPGTKPKKPSHPGKNPNPGENPSPKAKVKKEVDEQNPSPAPTTKPAPTKPGTKNPTKPRPSHPGKNPNPGENPSPKAKKISPENAKNEVIDVIIKMLEK